MYPSTHSSFLAYVIRDEDQFQNEITIFHLPDLKIVQTINLISYPGLLNSPEYNEELRGLKYALREDPIWSPDGRYLAFAGAIEGPSSDVYVYDTQSNQVKRLTSGSNQAIALKWSPDSRWIVHREVDGFGAGCYDIATWASAVDGSENQWLYQPRCDHLLGWLSPSTFMSFDRGMDGGRSLRYTDLTNGQVTTLFKGLFFELGFDPITGTVIFEPISENPATPEFPPGPYMVSPTNPIPEQFDSKAILFHWDESLLRLVSKDVPCKDGYIGSMNPSGESECIEQFPAGEDLIWSPDRRWAIDEATGRTLYNAAGEPVRQITPYGPNTVTWRPDSAGVFLKSEYALFSQYALLYLQIPDGNVFLVDDRSPEHVSWVGAD